MAGHISSSVKSADSYLIEALLDDRFGRKIVGLEGFRSMQHALYLPSFHN